MRELLLLLLLFIRIFNLSLLLHIHMLKYFEQWRFSDQLINVNHIVYVCRNTQIIEVIEVSRKK